MHINDIQAFAAKANMDKLFAGKKVVIRAPESKGGLYLTAHEGFSGTKAEARVYDYDGDKVGKQVETCIASGMPIEVELAP
jgi:hypothetical protein